MLWLIKANQYPQSCCWRKYTQKPNSLLGQHPVAEPSLYESFSINFVHILCILSLSMIGTIFHGRF